MQPQVFELREEWSKFNVHHEPWGADTPVRERAGYNPNSGGRIGASFHPVRWSLVAALAFPCLLVLIFLLARAAGYDSLAHHTIKAARCLIGAELIALLLLCSVGLVYEHRAQERDRKFYPAPGKLVDLGGYRLHLDCAGTGPTVVLEYGHQGAYTDWLRVRPQIADFARVCIYDRAGYGWSDSSPKARIPSIMADELHTLLHSAGEPPPYILVGHSFGGLNALMFAHKFPAEVRGIALVDASVPELMSHLRWRDRVRLRLTQVAIPFGLPRWRGWCGGSAPEEVRGMKQAITCRSSLYGKYYREWSSFPESADETRGIAMIGSVPLIVIARDPNIAKNTDREMEWNRLQRERVMLSSNSEFLVAEGSAHDVPMDRPDVIAAAVKKLVQTR